MLCEIVEPECLLGNSENYIVQYIQKPDWVSIAITVKEFCSQEVLCSYDEQGTRTPEDWLRG